MKQTLRRLQGLTRVVQAATALYIWYDHTQHVRLHLTDHRTEPIDEAQVRPGLRRLIVSDLHLGGGDRLDDFAADTELTEWIEQYAAAQPTEVILAGDTFEFLQVRLPGLEDTDWSEWAALRRFRAILAAHERPIGALRRLLEQPGHQVTLLIGNHDFELHYRAVKRALRDALGVDATDERLRFATRYEGGGMYLEHGNQFEPWNSFIHFDGISAPFEYIHGSRFVKDVINPIETEDVPHATLVDNVLPGMQFLWHLARTFSPRGYRVIVRGLWAAAWCSLRTPVYESAAMAGRHPVQRFVERTRRRFAGRFARHVGVPLGLQACAKPGTFDGIVMQAVNRIARQQVHRRLFVCGHTHVARMEALNAHQTYINTGTWTDVFFDLARNRRQEPRYPFLEVTYAGSADQPGAALFGWIGSGHTPRRWRTVS